MSKKIVRASLLVASLTLIVSSTLGQCVTTSFDSGIIVEAGGAGPTGEIASGELNGDGRTDIAVPRFITDTVSVMLSNPTGAPTVVFVTSVQRPWAVGIADFNHDGKGDLAVTHQVSSSIFLAVLLGDGAGGFGPPTDFPALLTKPLLIADFNNDTHPDVFLGNSSTNSSQVLLGNGSGGLAAPFTVPLPNNSKAVAADFNNDGKLDLATEYDGMNFVSVALGNGQGISGVPSRFLTVTHFSAASPLVTSIVTARLTW